MNLGSGEKTVAGGTAPRAPGALVAAWLVVAAWTAPALLATFETVMFARISGHPIELWRAFLSEAPGWYVWCAFTPIIARVAQRAPLVPLGWRAVLLHVASCLLVALAAAAVWAIAGLWLRSGASGFVSSLRNWFVSGLPFTVLVYAAIIGVVYSLTDRARLRIRERDAARLAQQLSEAQLASLRMQLRPHFLFNSLNAIMALVRDGENERAVAALALIGDMLRATLDSSSHEVSLSEEIAFTRRYLEMEKLRFLASACASSSTFHRCCSIPRYPSSCYSRSSRTQSSMGFSIVGAAGRFR